jgi:anti-sigma B factor antagonist
MRHSSGPGRLRDFSVLRIPLGNLNPAKETHMGLQISTRKSGSVTVVDLQGRITIGSSNDALGNELRQLAEASICDVIVNLAGVTQMDSSGISTLVRSFVTLERSGGGLKLLNPLGHVKEVLELTRLINSIPTFTDEEKCVASFRGGGAAHA